MISFGLLFASVFIVVTFVILYSAFGAYMEDKLLYEWDVNGYIYLLYWILYVTLPVSMLLYIVLLGASYE